MEAGYTTLKKKIERTNYVSIYNIGDDTGDCETLENMCVCNFIIVKGDNLQIIIVVGAHNGNINFRLPSLTVSVYCE